MATKVIMPKLGESVVEGTITKWLVNEGDQVNELDPLMEVETDKVTTEIPSPASGQILKILVPEGQTVAVETLLAWVGDAGEVLGSAEAPEQIAQAKPAEAGRMPIGAAQPEAEKRPETEQVAEEAPASVPETPAETQPIVTSATGLGFISPVVAKLASEFGVDLAKVTGTGEKGRITKSDVIKFIEATKQGKTGQAPSEKELAAWETPGEGDLFRPTEMVLTGIKPADKAAPAKTPPAKPAPVPVAAGSGSTLIPHTNMRRQIADHMVMSKHIAPHVTTVMEADCSRIVAHRAASKAAYARDGVNLTFTSYFAAAVVQALKAVPLANSSWTDEGMLQHSDINLGIAVALDDGGLIVPVIKQADGMSLLGLARAVNDLGDRARKSKLQPDEVKNGTFTITNHGVAGSLFATPVINQPQAGILGVGMIQKRAVVVEGDAIAVRPMVYLSFAFDHRILDGATADGFLAAVVRALETWPAA